MGIVRYTDTVAVMEDEDTEDKTNLMLLGGILSLSHFEWAGDTFSQKFQVDSLTDIFSKEGLRKEFPDAAEARKKALEHTTGRTDKGKFRASVKALQAEGRLTDVQAYELLNLIDRTTCPPVKFLERLVRLGYDRLVGQLDIYEPDPMLIRSVEVLMAYIEELP
jgi:hypothetical protein